MIIRKTISGLPYWHAPHVTHDLYRIFGRFAQPRALRVSQDSTATGSAKATTPAEPGDPAPRAPGMGWLKGKSTGKDCSKRIKTDFTRQTPCDFFWAWHWWAPSKKGSIFSHNTYLILKNVYMWFHFERPSNLPAQSLMVKHDIFAHSYQSSTGNCRWHRSLQGPFQSFWMAVQVSSLTIQAMYATGGVAREISCTS